MSTTILGTGSYLPERVIDNHELEAMTLDYDRDRAGSSLHDWAMKRVGVASRRHVAEGEGNVHLATKAARAALENADVSIDEIDLIILSTFTSDYRLPHTISLVQTELKSNAKCFQMEAACAGFIDSVIVAQAMLGTGAFRRALVIHTEVVSSLLDPQRFLEQTVFGDGAGAAVLAPSTDADRGVIACATHTDGSVAHYTLASGGGTLAPIDEDVLAKRSQYMRTDHKSIYSFAIEKFVDATREVVDLAGSTMDDVDWWIPHQTGRNIIDEAAGILGLPDSRVQHCIEHMGNTSGATVPIALDLANRRGDLRPDQHVVLSAVGGGMAWGGLYVVWG